MILLPDSHNPAFNYAIMTMRTFQSCAFFDYTHILSLVLIMRNIISLVFLIMRTFSLLHKPTFVLSHSICRFIYCLNCFSSIEKAPCITQSALIIHRVVYLQKESSSNASLSNL